MSRKTNGFVGTFSTSSDLESKYPAVDHVGCSANVGTTEPFSKYWSDGVSWAGFNSTEVASTQALVSGDGNFERALSAAGAVLNGTADDSAAIQEAINAITVAGSVKAVQMPRGVNIAKINSGLTINAAALAIDWCGMKLDASGLVTGTAITLTGQNVSPYNQHSNINVLERLILIGPNAEGVGSDGILIGYDSTVPGHATIANVLVLGFRDNLSIGSNYYISTFQNVHLREAFRYGLNYAGTSNTGENISFMAGSISDCKNAAGTGIGVYVPSASAGPDLFFFGTSYSYNDVAFDVQCGASNFRSCHFENKTDNPMGRITTVGGRPSTMVMIDGGQITHGSLGAVSETATGRPIMFDVNSSAGDRCSLVIGGGVRYAAYGKKTTQFVSYTGSGFPQIKVRDISIDQQGDTIGRICDVLSLLHNGGFETDATTGWTATGTSPTSDAVNYNTDSAGLAGVKSATWAGVTTTTGAIQQTFPCRPGDMVIARAFIKVGTRSAGTVDFKVYFLAANGSTAISTRTVKSLSAVQAAFTLAAQMYRAPPGTASVKVECSITGLTGTTNFDDVQAWIV